ncbi:type VI secretion system Vgr family protein [Desulfovibrio inopinatus]|uniref:type VI secretion system Vgr family protein n=1 Tax=Desulfovibrio inopinatus TaxID=102109 RepID=UPI0004246B1F|nr:type VI secretion system tip protein TssI/VgrG [Desulfovibrio inopinatus]
MDVQKRFSLQCAGLPEDTFSVISFTGTEGLSRPYAFTLELASEARDVAMHDILEERSTLRIGGGFRPDISIHGVLARFEEQHAVRQHTFYRAVLVPRLWCLGLTCHNQIFLNKTVPEIVAATLTDIGVLTDNDFEFRLSRTYPQREYVCQYRESHLNFLSRWLERDGLYYFFEQTDSGEKMIITDNRIAHVRSPESIPLRYVKQQGLDVGSHDDWVMNFVCEECLVPKRVLLKDYNYRIPNVDLSSTAPITEQGHGQFYMYGDNFKDQEEGEYLAEVRAEQIRSKQKMFSGHSSASFLRPGYLFSLINHYRDDFNTTYLVEELRHEGNQTKALLSGLGPSLSDHESKMFYTNALRAIPADTQFRPEQRAVKPRCYGTLNANVEADGDTDYAFLDEHGRYKVRLPFDIGGEPEGKASSWLRMAQPYGGAGHGMHFPLLKGTEVLLAFIDGDVDRPIISAALPNPEQQSMVDSTNAPANAIRSASGNQLVMGDKKGQEFIGMFSPHADSGIAMGSHKPGGGGSIAISTKGIIDSLAVGGQVSIVGGSDTSLVAGVKSDVTVGMQSDVSAAIQTEAALTSKVSMVKGKQVELGDEAMDLKNTMYVVGLDTVELSGGIGQRVDTQVKNAKRALKLGIAASVLSGLGVKAMTLPFDQTFKKNASLEWVAPSEAAGGLSTVAGLTLAGFCAKNILKVAKNYEEASENEKTSVISMDRNGIKGVVNYNVSENALLHFEVNKSSMRRNIHGQAQEQHRVKKKTIFEMTKKGTAIELSSLDLQANSKSDSAKATLQNGNEIKLAVTKWQEQPLSLTINQQTIGLLAKAKGGLSLSDTEAKLYFATGNNAGNVIAKTDEAVVSAGNSNKMSVKGDGVTITCSVGTINSSGKLTLKGSTVEIG